jgi:hypothetical protein
VNWNHTLNARKRSGGADHQTRLITVVVVVVSRAGHGVIGNEMAKFLRLNKGLDTGS